MDLYGFEGHGDYNKILRHTAAKRAKTGRYMPAGVISALLRMRRDKAKLRLALQDSRDMTLWRSKQECQCASRKIENYCEDCRCNVCGNGCLTCGNVASGGCGFRCGEYVPE